MNSTTSSELNAAANSKSRTDAQLVTPIESAVVDAAWLGRVWLGLYHHLPWQLKLPMAADVSKTAVAPVRSPEYVKALGDCPVAPGRHRQEGSPQRKK